MNKLILTLLGTMITSMLWAQTTEMELVKSNFNMGKKAWIAEYMDLPADKSDAFWKVYNEYQSARDKSSSRRFQLLNDYANTRGKMTNEQAAVWTKELFALQKQLISIKQKHFNRMANATSASTALRFLQMEEYMDTVVKYEVLEELPFVKSQ